MLGIGAWTGGFGGKLASPDAAGGGTGTGIDVESPLVVADDDDLSRC